MKLRFFLLFFMSCLSLFGVFSQTVKLTDDQKQKIAQALTRIQMADVSVEYLIYNGMTFDELQSFFPKTKLTIQSDFMTTYAHKYGEEWSNMCYFGTYIIFFSNCYQFTNPVIIGYAKQGDDIVYTKKL